MISIYKTNSYQPNQQIRLLDLLKELPKEMHERAHRYKFEQDALNYIVGRLLIKFALVEVQQEYLFTSLHYAENGKPGIDHGYINLSHSGPMVICAYSEKSPIGIDIELKKEIELNNFKAYFGAKEWDQIKADDSLYTFYRYWTRKESIIKALGFNLSKLHEIELDVDLDHFNYKNENWQLMDLDLGAEYVASICAKDTSGLRIKEIDLVELI